MTYPGCIICFIVYFCKICHVRLAITFVLRWRMAACSMFAFSCWKTFKISKTQVCLNNLLQDTIGGFVWFLILNYEVSGWIVVWWGVFLWCCSWVCSRIVHPKLKCVFAIGLCHNARLNGFSFRSKLLRSMGCCCRNQDNIWAWLEIVFKRQWLILPLFELC